VCVCVCVCVVEYIESLVCAQTNSNISTHLCRRRCSRPPSVPRTTTNRPTPLLRLLRLLRLLQHRLAMAAAGRRCQGNSIGRTRPPSLHSAASAHDYITTPHRRRRRRQCRRRGVLSARPSSPSTRPTCRRSSAYVSSPMQLVLRYGPGVGGGGLTLTISQTCCVAQLHSVLAGCDMF